MYSVFGCSDIKINFLVHKSNVLNGYEHGKMFEQNDN